MSQHWLEVRDISKNFGGVRALSEVRLDIAAGEIHALMGENGAGKSTLIKILGGALTPDAGSVSIAGEPLSLGSVRASEAAGIAVIHQECVAFGDLGAADNIFVGREPRAMGGLLLDRKQMRLQAKALLDQLGEGGIDINRPVGELALAQRQMVAIARALSHRCKLLIMDEPTASLSAREATNLFAIVRQLKAEGVSILYVSHRMEEIYALSDRVSVLRDGRYVGAAPTGELKEPDLIRMMVGRELLAFESEASPGFATGPTALELRKLSRAGAFVDISMNLRRGEIVGLGGLVGAGRSEVARAVFGIDRYDSGEVHVDGRRLAGGSVRAAMSAGLALAPEDRQSQGLIPPMSVGENLSLPSLPALSRFGWIRSAPKNRLIGEQMRDMRVKAASPAVPASTLSGGNQQKLVLGKWLAMRPKVLLLDEPTRGVDVGAKAEIYQLIRMLARAGAAILVISSDLPELLAISHRILVMRTGRIAGELSRAEATQEKLLELAMPLASPSPSPETSEAA